MSTPVQLVPAFTSANRNIVTGGVKITKIVRGTDAPSGSSHASSAVLNLMATSEDSSGSAIIEVVWAWPNSDGTAEWGILKRALATCTVTDRRNDWDNGSGEYVCDVVWTAGAGASGLLDLCGIHGPTDGVVAPDIYVCCHTLTTINDITVYVQTDRML